MAYSSDVVRRARERLDAAKTEKASIYHRRLQEVYAQIPRVREIDIALRKSMVLATQAVFSREEGAEDALEAVKKANMELQQERKALVEAKFGPDYLDESPVCPQCDGVGYVGSQMCQCLQELCRQEQRKELSLLTCGEGRFEDFRLDYYPDRPIAGGTISLRAIMKKTFIDCRSYAQNFGSHRENLLFSGDTGLGKTFLSACIARDVADQGYSVGYESAVHILEKMERAKFNDDEEAAADVKKYTQCDLLIVDDLGTEMAGQFVNTALYTLINDRMLAGKATIISTNLTADDMAKRYSPQILSRLRGNYRRVAFVGDDIRIMQNRGAVR